MAGLLFLSGCTGSGPGEDGPKVQSFGGLVCLEYSRYSGPFPEDGSGRTVQDVAAMKVRNSSDRFLDYATVEAQIGDQIGTFQITGLPPGSTVWVLESSGITLTAEDRFLATGCEDYFFRDEAVITTDKLRTETDGSTLKVTNTSKTALKNVCVYYKTVHTDGNYFGGITYMLNMGDLDPGQSASKQSSHLGEDSKIVRYSFQESG